MPLPLRPCGPNCSELVERGHCPAHTADAQRGSPTERGYDGQWRRFRKAFLLELAIRQGRPYAECEDCIERGELKPRLAKEVHHVKKVRTHPRLKLVKSNCRGLCGPCHRVRTARGE